MQVYQQQVLLDWLQAAPPEVRTVVAKWASAMYTGPRELSNRCYGANGTNGELHTATVPETNVVVAYLYDPDEPSVTFLGVIEAVDGLTVRAEHRLIQSELPAPEPG